MTGMAALAFMLRDSDVSAEGEEAFTPPSEAQTVAVALMQEKHFGDVLLQFGARIEHVELTADNVLLPSLDAHAHDESEEEDAHDHDHDHDDETPSSHAGICGRA